MSQTPSPDQTRRPSPASTTALSREFVVLCDRGGIIRWIDDRASRLLGVAAGDDLRRCAIAGTEHRLAALFEQGGPEAARDVEISLVLDGEPAVVSVSAAPYAGAVLVIGAAMPREHASLLARVAAAMSDLSTLPGQAERAQIDLATHHDALQRLSRDLDESGRGMQQLYATINDRDDSLHRATESRSRFVASVSHELRTPLASILGLTTLLLSRADGELTAEQDTQVQLIRRSAEALSTLVDDLLDLSKIEAGKLTMRPQRFAVQRLLGGLRGSMRPIATNPNVVLVVEPPPADLPELESDEGKIAQVLRNLVSNALKFTERGEVRVRTRREPDGTIAFEVRDTGIGIAREHQELIFEEFAQIDSPIQRRLQGSGLGLSVSRRLASLLGGTLTVQSVPGEGSTFTLRVPPIHPDVEALAGLRDRSMQMPPDRAPVLVVEDDPQTLFLYERFLRGSGFQVVPANSVGEAQRILARLRPAAIVLDVMLDGESTWAFLAEMKSDPATREIPTLVVTVVDRENKARALGADEFHVKPLEREWLLHKLRALATRAPVERVLVIDDDDVARYLVRRLLAGTTYQVLEAASGEEGLPIAREAKPHIIFLDFVLPGMSAFEVLDRLKADPRTRDIPVVINTSKKLSDDERQRLARDAADILSKEMLSREIAITRIRDALSRAVDTNGAAGRGAGGNGVAHE